MKKILLSLVVVPAMFIVGCIVTSVYPFYTEKDLTFDPALIGQWIEKESNESSTESAEVWEFAKAGEKKYTFTISKAEETNKFSAHLFKLGGKRFLDWRAEESPDDFVPPHYLLRVRQVSPTLLIEPMNAEWLAKLIEENSNAIRHIVLRDKNGSGERVVLTADTMELQAFVLKHINDTNAFGDNLIELKPRKIASDKK
jgi:hypothetical protein